MPSVRCTSHTSTGKLNVGKWYAFLVGVVLEGVGFVKSFPEVDSYR